MAADKKQVCSEFIRIEYDYTIENGDSLTKFVAPATILLVGQSNSGKSHYVRKLIDNGDAMFTIPPTKYVWLYNMFQPLYDEIERTTNGTVSFVQGLPSRSDIESWAKGESHLCLIVDDLYHQLINSRDMLDLFVMLCHHLCASVITTSHNIFMGGKFSKTITLNSHYILLFRLQNRLQLATLGTQLFCHNKAAKHFVRAYDRCMDLNQYSPLVIDLSPISKFSHLLKLRCDILPGQYPIVFALD